MRKIILASRSKARRALLRQIGVNCTVALPAVDEGRSLKKGCARLVMDNAKKKALNVARRYKEGVVIAADTVVVDGKKIAGKPKTEREAVRMLKRFSKKPQWVYTGIAVVDVGRRRTFTDYDKTKIYMVSMSEDRIKGYYRKVSPFDKAGGFDIQGLGGIFIGRIEGCFYNVVGLPLAKLAKMLDKAGINFLG